MDVLYLKWKDPDSDKKYIIGALCRRENKYYFKLSKEHVEEAIKHGFSMFTIPFSDFDKIYESDEIFSIFKIRLPKIENYDEEDLKELLDDMKMDKFDEFEYLEKTKGIISQDNFVVEKEK